MRLRFLGINTGKDGCPTLYASDRDTYVIQGWRVSDPAKRGQFDLSPEQTCVEVPRPLMAFLELDSPSATVGEEAPPFVLTADGTYLIKGPEVTDAEALGQMDIPDHETVVEVPRRLMNSLAKDVAWSG